MQPPQFLGPGPLGQQHSPPHPKQPPPTPRPALRAAPLVGFSPSPLSPVRGFSTLSWGWLSLCLNIPPHTHDGCTPAVPGGVFGGPALQSRAPPGTGSASRRGRAKPGSTLLGLGLAAVGTPNPEAGGSEGSAWASRLRGHILLSRGHGAAMGLGCLGASESCLPCWVAAG